MTDISNVVKVTVNVKDTRITRAGFGVLLIFDGMASSVFPERVRAYPNMEALAIDFPSTTKVYQAANAIFSQQKAPETIKVGRRDAGDANLTEALNAIAAEDDDWYCLLTPNKSAADVAEIAAWVESHAKTFLVSSEDGDVLTNAVSDIASTLKGASYQRTAYMWHHQAGVDDGGAATATVSDGVVTVINSAHGLRVGDPITTSTYPDSAAVGNFTVSSVAGPDTFTYPAPGAADDAVGASIDYFARYTFPEAAWAGLQLPNDPGSSTWKFKRLTGITPAPRSVLSPNGEANALGKNANLYTEIAGVGATHEGVMSSGRFIDVQRGIDWLEAHLAERVYLRLQQEPKVPYTDAGAAVIQAEIAGQLDEAVRRDILGPLLDSESGEFYRIHVPKVADQNPSDRANRVFPGITAQAQLAGAIHRLEITVNAQV